MKMLHIPSSFVAARSESEELRQYLQCTISELVGYDTLSVPVSQEMVGEAEMTVREFLVS